MATNLSELKVLIRGAGEVASGIAHRLHRCHFKVCLTEIEKPLAVSRGTAFSEAVWDGTKTIEEVTAVLVPNSAEDIYRVWRGGNIAIVIDARASVKEMIRPDVIIDAVMAKRNIGTKLTDAPLVIGAGSGFYAGKDVHVVIETKHSNNLGRVILEGEAERDTGTPVAIGGLTKERVIWASRPGAFTTEKEIAEPVQSGQVIGWVENVSIEAPVGGMLRGLLRSGASVLQGDKLVEVDPENDGAVCYVIRDKMRAIAGGVLEAIMMKYNTDNHPSDSNGT